MQNLIKRLEKRGWDRKDISEAVLKIHNAKQLKTPETRFLEKRIYFILLLIVMVANFAISISLIPLLIALKGLSLYLILAILGIVFGLLFELVIRSIEHLEQHHHLTLTIFIPSIGLANLFFVTKITNKMTGQLNFNNVHNPMFIGIIYAISFVLPYIFYRFILKMEYYSKE